MTFELQGWLQGAGEKEGRVDWGEVGARGGGSPRKQLASEEPRLCFLHESPKKALEYGGSGISHCLKRPQFSLREMNFG